MSGGVERLVVGPFQTNTYIVHSSGRCIIVDPGWDCEVILSKIQKLGLEVELMVATHIHIDHINAVECIKRETGAPLAFHEKELELLSASPRMAAAFGLKYPEIKADTLLKEGQEVTVGGTVLRVLHTPGHSPGSITLAGDGYAFTGDLIFMEGVGRTDFPGGSWEVLESSIREKILTMPEDTVLYPGHGPETTVRHERKFNPWIRSGF